MGMEIKSAPKGRSLNSFSSVSLSVVIRRIKGGFAVASFVKPLNGLQFNERRHVMLHAAVHDAHSVISMNYKCTSTMISDIRFRLALHSTTLSVYACVRRFQSDDILLN